MASILSMLQYIENNKDSIQKIVSVLEDLIQPKPYKNTPEHRNTLLIYTPDLTESIYIRESQIAANLNMDVYLFHGAETKVHSDAFGTRIMSLAPYRMTHTILQQKNKYPKSDIYVFAQHPQVLERIRNRTPHLLLNWHMTHP